MKKITLLFFLSIWYSASYSQTFHFDLGTSYTKLDWKYILPGQYEKQYNDPLLGYSFSSGIEYFEHKYFSVSSDLLFYKSGGKYSKEDLNANFSLLSPEKISVSYLSLGSSVNFNPLNNKFKLQLSLGPRIDYLIDGAKKGPYEWFDERNGLNKINFGYTAGIGFYYNLNDYVIGINMKYLGRMRKLADSGLSIAPNYTYVGVVATEQIFLTGFSFSYRLKP